MTIPTATTATVMSILASTYQNLEYDATQHDKKSDVRHNDNGAFPEFFSRVPSEHLVHHTTYRRRKSCTKREMSKSSDELQFCHVPSSFLFGARAGIPGDTSFISSYHFNSFDTN